VNPNKLNYDMKNLRNITLVAMILFLASCGVSGPAMNMKALVTKNPVGTKVGIAEKKVWFGLAFDVDLGIAAAAKKGNITKVATVDREVISGFFNVTYRTIVTGTSGDEGSSTEDSSKSKKRSRSKTKGRR
tara:strand:+ start:371 stop:763 length:393 start_codon:yes stop_codon:yes gene_type:complete